MYLDRLELTGGLFRDIDPRCRLGAGVLLILTALTLTEPLTLGALILAAALTLRGEGKRVWKRLIPVNLFSLALFLTLPLGAAIEAGLDRAVLGGAVGEAVTLALRINAGALLSMSLILPLGVGGLSCTLLKLRCPGKLAALLVLTYRALFVMYRRLFVSVASLKLRQPPQGLLGQWRGAAAVFGTALGGALGRSRRMGQALRVRGFEGTLPLTRSFALRGRDLCFVGGAAVLAVLLRLVEGALR